MSKAFALAGARVGYLAADPAVVDALLLVRLPYHLSALTQAVARAALRARRTSCWPRWQRAAGRARRRWWPGCASQGLAVADSDANFVLFGRFADRRAVWQGLLDPGVLIREVGPPRLAAGQRRHRRGDGRVPRRAERGAGRAQARAGRQRREPVRSGRAASPRRPRSLVELDLDGTGHRPTSPPACRSSTTCWPSSASTACST